ncbi:MAG: enoyl-CoA hydratase/isomerase family protein [Bdellovibrionales bacterium]|nr:enoyl-CoA hydratase/isomerase family protein [Bdellovibrionales bacterium]
MTFLLKDDFLEVILNSPKTRNALSVTHARELKSFLKNKNLRGLILRSVGPVFCSGGDLGEYARLSTKAQGTRMNREISEALSTLAHFPAPKLALVDGDCYGGGVELISCCDWIVSTPKSFFALWQRRMTLSFGWGGYQRLKTRMSESAIKAWIQSGDTKSSYWAQSQGLINDIIHEKNVIEYLEQWKAQQLLLTTSSFTSIQRLTGTNERTLFDKLWWSKEHLQKLKSKGNRK